MIDNMNSQCGACSSTNTKCFARKSYSEVVLIVCYDCGYSWMEEVFLERQVGFTNKGIQGFSKGLLGSRQHNSPCPYCDMGTDLMHESGCPNSPNQTIYVDS
jgi:hypothetical protein